MKVIDQVITDKYAVYHGDCVEVMRGIPDNSIHFSVFSPPFSSLYTYSNSDRDMGNCKGDDEFMQHYMFLVKEQFRTMMPGRLISIHCMNLPTSKTNHGYIGIRDFRGDLIRMYEDAGFIYHSEVCIWKDPVIAMQRTKALGLLHKQLRKDSAMSRQGIPDYIITLRKPGNNPEPISHTRESFPVSLWQEYASPIWHVPFDADEMGMKEGQAFIEHWIHNYVFDAWDDINPSDTLQHRSAREDKDEKHIAPLQLEVIRRLVRLWSNPGDTILSPFGGIGSEGVVAVEEGRKSVSIELKQSYYEQNVRNHEAAATEAEQPTLF